MAVDLTNVQVEPLQGAELTLRGLNTKTNAGGKLTGAEILMGMNAAATQDQGHYGIHPRDTQINSPEVPESLKGAIASARA